MTKALFAHHVWFACLLCCVVGQPVTTQAPNPDTRSSSSSRTLVIIVCVTIGVVLVILGLASCYLWRRKRRRDLLNRPPINFETDYTSPSPAFFNDAYVSPKASPEIIESKVYARSPVEFTEIAPNVKLAIPPTSTPTHHHHHDHPHHPRTSTSNLDASSITITNTPRRSDPTHNHLNDTRVSTTSTLSTGSARGYLTIAHSNGLPATQFSSSVLDTTPGLHSLRSKSNSAYSLMSEASFYSVRDGDGDDHDHDRVRDGDRDRDRDRDGGSHHHDRDRDRDHDRDGMVSSRRTSVDSTHSWHSAQTHDNAHLSHSSPHSHSHSPSHLTVLNISQESFI